MLFHLSLWAGKTAGKSSQSIGLRGTSIPGMVSHVIDFNILKKLGKQVENIIVVTGTNGKTTTSNLLTSVFNQKEPRLVHNNAGSNLITGVTSCFINESDLLGRIKKTDFAILEVDEATLVKVLKKITPKMIVITNFFRDQLDRFGEIDELIKKMEDSIRPIETTLMLNADDPFSYRLRKLNKKTIYFGLKANAYAFDQHEMNDSKFCPDCGNELKYDFVHYGQLGFFNCECGFKRPKAKYEVDAIDSQPFVSIKHTNHIFDSHFKGAYNAYNLMATIGCAKEFGFENDAIYEGLMSFEPNNGRMQAFYSGDYPYMLNLAKNPQGVNSTISEFLGDKNEKQMVLFLNDLDADGKDPSWIWDADYELLQKGNVTQIICSGFRAFDMAIRIQYAGIPKEKIKVLPDVTMAIDESLKKPMNTYLISNYTALEFVKETLEEHPKINFEFVEV